MYIGHYAVEKNITSQSDKSVSMCKGWRLYSDKSESIKAKAIQDYLS